MNNTQLKDIPVCGAKCSNCNRIENTSNMIYKQLDQRVHLNICPECYKLGINISVIWNKLRTSIVRG